MGTVEYYVMINGKVICELVSEDGGVPARVIKDLDSVKAPASH